ncbi:MAG TPA: hypothetical protein VJB10_00655 [Candidatus Peribacteraceae bacterium]|nr:hypothetical protein [Candidatus Peribacteraceae bacterium]
MRRPFLLGLTLSLVTPLAALAYFTQPSALLKAVEFDGKPRSFTMEAHARMEDTYASLWMNGEGEGRTLDTMKGKWHATVDFAEEGMQMRMKLSMVLHQQVVYVRIDEFNANVEDAVLQASIDVLQKKWISIPLEMEQAQVGGRDAFITGFVDGMALEGIFVEKEQVEKLLDGLVDALLSMEYTQFTGGHAYSLRLKDGFLYETLLVLNEFFSAIDGEDLGLGDLVNDPSTQETEAMIRNAVNLHIKINTNDAQDFLFAKFYLAAQSPVLPGFSFVTQGEVQRKMTPVYVEVPSEAHIMTLEEFLEYLDGENILSQFEGLELLESGFPGEEFLEWPEEEVLPGEDTGDTWENGSDWWEEEVDEETGEEVWEPRRTSRQQEPREDIPCTGSPDSLEYLFLSRKGICPLADRERGVRVNDQISPKRLRTRAVEEQRQQENLERVQSYQRRAED